MSHIACPTLCERSVNSLADRPRTLRMKRVRRPPAPTASRVAEGEGFRYRLVIKLGAPASTALRPIVGIDDVLNILNRIHQERSPILRLLVGAMLLALTFAGGFAVAAHKTVTLEVDGTTMTVATMKTQVIDVVKENGFDVGERDDLYPAAHESVRQSDTIVLRRSRPLQISTDGQDNREVWTTASTVDEALSQLQMTDKAPA